MPRAKKTSSKRTSTAAKPVAVPVVVNVVPAKTKKRAIKRVSAKPKVVPAKTKTVPVAAPTMVAVTTHPEPAKTAREIQGFAIRSWVVFLGLGSLVLAFAAGFWSSAEQTGKEISYVAPVHREGKVAGATVTAHDQPVTIVVSNGTDKQTYEIQVAEQISVYNLLRSAGQATVLSADFQDAGAGIYIVQRVGSVSADAHSTWSVTVDGQAPTSLADPVVQPGSTVTLTYTTRK